MHIHQNLTEKVSKCNLAPLCFDCNAHDEFECNFLVLAKLPKNFLIDNFDVITPLRCIILSKNPTKIDLYKRVMELESHCEERRGTPIWALHEKCVVKPLKDVEMIREQDELLIQKYCGILDVNTFEVRTESFEVYLWFHGHHSGIEFTFLFFSH